MQLAQSVLSSNQDSNRDKVVVMFTDGTPTSGEDFESSVASGAISASKALKDKDVKVYTIGIFSGANPKADVTKKKTSAENKYMHAMSSNYPDATLTSTQTGFLGSTEWHWNFGTRAQGSNYYLSAKNSTELNNVFQTISNSITTTHVTANESAVLRDTLTKQFVFNGTDASAITVKKAKVTDKNGDTYSWGTPENVDGITKEISSDRKTVTVTGFDYTSTGTTGNVITKNGNDYSGYKLIVTIPIKVDKAYEGWQAGKKNYDTNTTGDNNKAGLTGYTKNGEEASTLLNESPQVPVTAYKVTYQYSDNCEGAPPLTNYNNDDKGYLPRTSIKIEEEPTWTGYTFSGWKLPEGLTAGEDGRFSMPAEDVVITGSWTENEIHINYVALEGGTIQEAGTETPQRYSETVKLGQANPQATGATAKPDNGKYFAGWYSNEDCSDESFVSGDVKYVPKITSQQDVTYYAKFSDKQTITIQVPNETLTYTGEELTGKGYSNAETTGLPEGCTVNVTNDGYTPAKGTNVSSSDAPYTGSFANPQFTISQGGTDVTSKFNVNTIPGKLYIQGKVTYDANTNDTTVSGLPKDESTYFLNQEVTANTEDRPTRDGYDFVGWTLSNEDQAFTVDKGQMGTTGLTFYAKWSEKKVEVDLSQLIQKQLTLKDGSTLPDSTTFTVTVKQEKVNDQTVEKPKSISGSVTVSALKSGTPNGDTYTAPFIFDNDGTLSLSAGTYTYTVQETEGDVSGAEYDSTIYQLKIEAKMDGTYSASYTVTPTSDAAEAAPTDVTPAAPLTIQNTYQAPNLSVTKQPYKVNDVDFNADKTVAHVGDKIIWSVTVKNNGGTTASTTLKETLTGAAVYDNEACTGDRVDTNGTWTATVFAGKTKIYYVTYKVQAADISNGKIVNAIVKDGDNNNPINSDPVSTWDTKQLKSATSNLNTSDWTTTVTLELPTVSKTEQQSDPIAVKSGSYVIDQIGNEFTFVPELTLKVGKNEYTGKKGTSDANGTTYTFGRRNIR